MNLIKYKVNSKLKEEKVKSSHPFKKLLFTLTIFSIAITSGFVFLGNKKQAQAFTIGLENNYEEMISMNNSFSNVVPLPIESIQTEQQVGDKRIIAMLMFLEKYKSPMASLEVAKTFVESADKYGIGDKWQLLASISGIESGFGKMIPYNVNTSSYNAWGWTCVGSGCTSRWRYFSSWEEAIDVITNGLATFYGPDALSPQVMMPKYCPDCAEGGGKWAVYVQGYINELNSLYESI